MAIPKIGKLEFSESGNKLFSEKSKEDFSESLKEYFGERLEQTETVLKEIINEVQNEQLEKFNQSKIFC